MSWLISLRKSDDTISTGEVAVIGLIKDYSETLEIKVEIIQPSSPKTKPNRKQ